MPATHQRITVKGPSVVEMKLAPMAERTGLPAMLPENVHHGGLWRARQVWDAR